MRVNDYRKLNVITKYVYQTFNKNFLEMLELELKIYSHTFQRSWNILHLSKIDFYTLERLS